MLAQNFMTPAALGLDDCDFEALLRTLGMLERGEVPQELFDMGVVGQPECGSPGCIYGWANTVGFKHNKSPDKLRRLFAPRFDEGCPSPYAATPAQAAIALRNYLTHGEARWAEAMSA